MQLFENIHLALSSLAANKFRAFLTMLGIIIGIGSVITIVTVGDSLSGSMNEQLSGLGGKNVAVGVQQRLTPEMLSGNVDPWYEYEEPTAADLITLAMIGEYQKTFGERIAAVSVSEALGEQTIPNGKRKASVSLYGVNSGFSVVEKLELRAGRWLTQKDMDDVRSVAMVSDKFVSAYFGSSALPEDALGQYIAVELGGRTAKLYIIGVFAEPQNGNYSFDNGSSRLLLPLPLGQRLTGSTGGCQSLTVQPNSTEDSAAFQKNTAAFFASYYMHNAKFEIQTYSDANQLKAMNTMMDQLKLGIGAIAAISLLVGGIGVMNIMMVSVTERTREIGVRMALGAKSRAILMQFVVEAIIVCLIGGILGVTLGVGCGMAASHALHFTPKPSLPVIALSVGFSMAIGLFFGYYPAKKAARLDPIEALRYE